MTVHSSAYERAGQDVTVDADLHVVGPGRHEFRVEDWADRVFGRSWMVMDGNPVALVYAVRSAAAELPTDDQVLYGKVGHRAHPVHVSEIVGGEQR
jgi:hypothetical protein